MCGTKAIFFARLTLIAYVSADLRISCASVPRDSCKHHHLHGPNVLSALLLQTLAGVVLVRAAGSFSGEFSGPQTFGINSQMSELL